MKSKKAVFALSAKHKMSSFFKRMFTSILLIACLCTTGLSLGIFLSVNTNQRNILRELQNDMLVQAYNANQSTLKDIVIYCDQKMEDPIVRELMYNTKHDVVTMLKIDSAIESITSISSLIHSVYIVNFEAETITSKFGISPFDKFADQDILSILQTHVPSSTPTVCLPRVMPLLQSNTKSFSSIPTLTTIFHYNKAGALVINIDYERYSKIIFQNSNDRVNLILLNQNHTVFSTTDESIWGENYQYNTIYQKIKESSDLQNSFHHEINNTTYSVNYIKNRGFGMSYICLLENSDIYLEDHQLFTILLCTSCFLIFAIVLSTAFSYINYKPIKHLKERIDKQIPQTDSPHNDPQNDIAYLSDRYQALLTSHMEHQTKLHKEKEKKMYMALLANATDIYTEYASELRKLNELVKENNCFILQATIDPASLARLSASDLELMVFAIHNITEEKLSETSRLQLLSVSAPSVVYLVYSNHSSTEYLNKPLWALQNFMQQNFNITFSVGIGSTIDDITELSSSFDAAQKALTYRFLLGENAIYIADLLPETCIENEVYPYALEEDLINAIKSLSVTHVIDCLDAFFTAISSYSVDRIILFILYLSSSIYRLEYSNNIEIDSFWNYREIERSTLDTIKSKLTERCIACKEYISSQKKANSTQQEIVDAILTLIAENMGNSELSVIFLANQVHLSVNYLRSIFKDCMGETLSAYITRKKLEMICDLLAHTDLTLEEIGEKLGFSTLNYFYTFFKKHTGMTPREYQRNKCQEYHNEAIPGQNTE